MVYQVLCPRQRAIGHSHVVDTQLPQVGRCQGGHRSRTNDQRAVACQGLGRRGVIHNRGKSVRRLDIAQSLIHREGDHGSTCRIDAGLGVYALTRAQGALRQIVQGAPDCARFIGGLIGAAQLADDLLLPHNHRIQPGSDLQHMFRRGVGVVHIQMRLQVRGLQSRELRNRLHHMIQPGVEGVGDGVKLHAVTRGQHKRFGNHIVIHQRKLQLRKIRISHRGLLQHRHRRRTERQPDQQHRRGTSPGVTTHLSSGLLRGSLRAAARGSPPSCYECLR